MSKDIDIGAISESLNDKADRDLNNTQPPLTRIIETYIQGTEGYRIWSDGYCEQWGTVASGGTATLVKSYKDTNFNVQHSLQYSETSANANAIEFVILANNQIRLYRYTPNIGTSTIVTNHWRTCGYLAEGEY